MQTQALDIPAQGSASQLYTQCIWRFATKNSYWKKHNKAQESENKLANFIIIKKYTKNNFMFHTLSPVTGVIRCFLR